MSPRWGEPTGRLLLVPQHRHWAYEPSEIFARRGVVVALEVAANRLVLIDADHPALASRTTRGRLTPADACDALAVYTAASGPATTGFIWEAVGDDHDLTAPFDRVGLVPRDPEWTVASHIQVISLRHAEPGFEVTHHRTPLSPGTSQHTARDLLRILLVMAGRSTTARAIVDRVLAGQPLRSASIKHFPAHAAPVTKIRADRSAAFLWDRTAVMGIAFLIAGGSAAVSAAVRTNHKSNTNEVAASVIPEIAQNQPESAAALGSADDGVHLSLAGAATAWIAVPDIRVEHDGQGWRLDKAPPTGWIRRPVARIALVAAGRCLHFDPPAGSTLGGALQSLRELTHQEGEHRVTVTRPTEPARSIASATLAARERAARLLAGAGGEPDGDALRLVVTSYRESAGLPDLDEALRAALRQVNLQRLEQEPFGREVISLIALQSALTDRPVDDRFDTGPFADGLTSYVNAVHAAEPEHADWLWARVAWLVARWLSADGTGVATLEPARWRLVGDLAWEELATVLPWLRWLTPGETERAPNTPLTALQYLEALILLRPAYGHTTFDLCSWRRLYQSPVALSDRMLEELAKCLEPFPSAPVRTARTVDGVQPPEKLREVIDALVSAALPPSHERENLLGVRVDDRDRARVVMVNLTADRPLDVQVGDESLRLAPRAIDHPTATAYCSAPLDIAAGAVVVVGRDTVSLAAQPSQLASEIDVTLHMLPHDLFRGRRVELARLLHALEGDGPRTGNLIFGTRRAGKSSLAYRVATDDQAGGHVWLDMSDTSVSVASFGQWAEEIVPEFRRRAAAELSLTLDGAGADLIAAIRELDEAVEGRRPVVVVLDELDVLLLPEQGSDGRRLAGRLGSMITRNVVLIGTVQRFHESAHEFKSWNLVACGADLTWADGVGYFFTPLIDERPGPRVERLTRVGATPEMFAKSVEPWTGLRPYFWAQLRSRLAGHLRTLSPDASRLVDAAALERCVDTLITSDAHLNAVMDTGEGLDDADRRRRDLFSLNERRILVLFANVEVGSTVPVAQAIRAGGDEGVRELVGRAYLAYDATGTRLRVAVPIYHRFLRLRRTDLIAVSPSPIWELPRETSASVQEVEGATGATFTAEDLVGARAAVQLAIEYHGGLAPLSSIADQIQMKAGAIPASSWAETGSPQAFIETFFADLARTDVDNVTFFALPSHAYAMSRSESLPSTEASEPADVRIWLAQRPDSAPELDDTVRRVRTVLLRAMAPTRRLSLSQAGDILGVRVPELAGNKFFGAGSLSRFIDRHLDDLRRVPGEAGGWLAMDDRWEAPTSLRIEDLVARTQQVIADMLAATDTMEPLSRVGAHVLACVPEMQHTKWAGEGRLGDFLDRYCGELRRLPGPGGGFIGPPDRELPLPARSPRKPPEERNPIAREAPSALIRRLIADANTALDVRYLLAALREAYPDVVTDRRHGKMSRTEQILAACPELRARHFPPPPLIYDPRRIETIPPQSDLLAEPPGEETGLGS